MSLLHRPVFIVNLIHYTIALSTLRYNIPNTEKDILKRCSPAAPQCRRAHAEHLLEQTPERMNALIAVPFGNRGYGAV